MSAPLLNIAFPKVFLISKGKKIKWGRFLGLEIVGFREKDDEELSTEEKNLVKRAVKKGNLHVSLVKFLENSEQEVDHSPKESNTSTSEEEIAHKIVENAFLKFNNKKNVFDYLLKKYLPTGKGEKFTILLGAQLDKQDYNLPFLEKNYNLTRKSDFMSLLKWVLERNAGKEYGDPQEFLENFQRSLENFIAEQVSPEEFAPIVLNMESESFDLLREAYVKKLEEGDDIELETTGFVNTTEPDA